MFGFDYSAEPINPVNRGVPPVLRLTGINVNPDHALKFLILKSGVHSKEYELMSRCSKVCLGYDSSKGVLLMQDAGDNLYLSFLHFIASNQHFYTKLQLIAVMFKIANAVQSAHNKDVVHGDIKPQNLALMGSVEEGRVELIDFGLSGIEGSKKNTYTFDQKEACKHISPECFAGSDEDNSDYTVSKRQDVFSLCYLFLDQVLVRYFAYAKHCVPGLECLPAVQILGLSALHLLQSGLLVEPASRPGLDAIINALESRKNEILSIESDSREADDSPLQSASL